MKRWWFGAATLAAVFTSISWGAIPTWTIKEVPPLSPPDVGAWWGEVFKGTKSYYVGLDPGSTRMLFEYDYWSETSTPVPGTEGIGQVFDVSDKYILYCTTPSNLGRLDLWLFDGATHRNIIPYDEMIGYQSAKISGEYVVWQHEGGTLGNGIFLYDIAAGTISRLNDPGIDPFWPAEGPDIDYPYVIWEDSFPIACGEPHSNSQRRAMTIRNIETGMRGNTAQEVPDCMAIRDEMGRISYPYIVFERAYWQYDEDQGHFILLFIDLMARDLRSGSTIPLVTTPGPWPRPWPRDPDSYWTSQGNVLWKEYSANGLLSHLKFWDGSGPAVPVPMSGTGSVAYARLHGANILFRTNVPGVGYVPYIALADADTDGDGLLDSWERKGLDINDDGTIDLDLPGMGADPRHKDLFVEADRMGGVPFSYTALDMVRTAFANAPVANPDGINGIDLHIQVDDLLPRQITIDDGFVDFKTVKGLNWGTNSERTHPTNAENILKARKRAFRYCLFANQFVPSGAIGLAERPGNDFAVALGGLPAGMQTDHELAVVFMHELGHNLGLDEGGGDAILFKPNYVSVMNYGFGEFQEDGTGDLLIPDFSREAMLPLDESNLDETIGIESLKTPDVLSFYGLTDPNGVHLGIFQVLLDSQPWDWNANFDMTETGLAMDLTWLYPNDPNYNPPTPGQILNGFDDWANVQLPIGTTGAFADMVAADLEAAPMTEEVRQWLREQVPHIPVLADINDNRRIDMEDLAIFAAYWQQAQCGECGGADFTKDANVISDNYSYR
jgi:hypothetical protein